MLKTTVIHQPDFLPYLGFFHRLIDADLFIVLDHVQFSSSNWTHRDKIKTTGGVKWLTASLEKTPLGTAICDVKLSQQYDWREQHLNKLEAAYKNAGYFEETFPLMKEIYRDGETLLANFNIHAIDCICKCLGIEIARVYSSEMHVEGNKTDMLISLLSQTDSTTYLSGVGARDYLQTESFESANIKLTWQEFDHPVYSQLHGDFAPYLSTIDVLFNCGIDGTKQMLRTL